VEHRCPEKLGASRHPVWLGAPGDGSITILAHGFNGMVRDVNGPSVRILYPDVYAGIAAEQMIRLICVLIWWHGVAVELRR